MKSSTCSTLLLFTLPLLVACGSAQTPSPANAAGSGGTGGNAGSGGTADSCEYQPIAYLQPVADCCPVGATDKEADARAEKGDFGPRCRGRCAYGLVGKDAVDNQAMCNCGRVTFDSATGHQGPPPCAEGEECCPFRSGSYAEPWDLTCVKKGECVDCRPPASSADVRVDCCGGEACRGFCKGDPLDAAHCTCGDGPGCGEGMECCESAYGRPEEACVPVGTCKPLTCPPKPTGPGVAVDCCPGEGACHGACEGSSPHYQLCVCGGTDGVGPDHCDLDEECCLGPSGSALEADAHCVKIGTCVTP